MQQVLRSLLLFSAVACPFALLAYGQEAESVGDIARQARQQKQNKDGKSKAATTSTTPKIITNDEIPEHSEAAEEPTGSEGEGHAGTSSASASDGAKMSAEQWNPRFGRKRIWFVHCKAASRSSMTRFNSPRQLRRRLCTVERTPEAKAARSRTGADPTRKPEEAPQSARKQGYGSSVYDP